MKLKLLLELQEESKTQPYGGKSKFISSSDVYFREYKIPEGFWKKDKSVLYGDTTFPLEKRKGIPEDYGDDDKEPEFYTLYTYAIFEDIDDEKTTV